MSLTNEEKRPRIALDNGNIIEYVGGPHPYLWIGDEAGNCYDHIDIDPLKDFIGPLRREQKEKVRA